jgi:hypothetical protein
MTDNKKNWMLGFLLTTPMIIFFIGSLLNHDGSLVPTGFIMHDNVSYIAYAKQYLDSDHFHLFYSNPFNDSENYPHIYFQPQTLLFAFLLWLKIPPGFIMIPFTWLCTLISFRIIIGIYDHLVQEKKFRILSIVFFCWGGGLLALAGTFAHFIKPAPGMQFLDYIFVLDPGWGWWGLNLGRAFFISCEAYYHMLFLVCILCILKKKWSATLFFAALLSLSHPFTGIELLGIISLWVLIEKFLYKNRSMPWWFLVGILIITGLHIYYYLFYLNQFPDQRSVSNQYALNWRLRFFNMIPAYSIVGGLSIISVIKSGSLKSFLQNSNTRLFLCWFLIAFTLANHELFLKPMQPLHFTRGYIWTSLFLLGLPGLHSVLNFLKNKNWRIAHIVFIILFLSDNFLWILNEVRFKRRDASETHISKEQKSILTKIRDQTNNKSLIIGSDLVPYMSTVYTRAYPWISHPYSTPFYKQKKQAYDEFINSNKIDSAWRGRDVIFVFRKNDSLEAIRSQQLNIQASILIETKSYKVLRVTFP